LFIDVTLKCKKFASVRFKQTTTKNHHKNFPVAVFFMEVSHITRNGGRVALNLLHMYIAVRELFLLALGPFKIHNNTEPVNLSIAGEDN
jgi:hypothetical protein